MFLAILTLISGICISIIAAGYSIIGLATLFAGAVVPIIAMGSALEVGKLVVASWLYRNWQSSLLPRSIKYYLTISVIVLVFITSMGIFGFLSKAHLDQVKPTTSNKIKIDAINVQIKQQQSIVDRSQNTLKTLDKALDKYVDMEYVTRGLNERKKQAGERAELNGAINKATDLIVKLQNEKANLQLAQDKIEAEVGPIKYIAELIYGKDEAKSHFDEAVRIVILILIFVFDPLAVLMLIAANISIREWQLRRSLTQAKKQENIEDRLERVIKQNKKLKEKERDFRNLMAQDLQDIDDPDEIKLKLNQIYDWNDKKN